MYVLHQLEIVHTLDGVSHASLARQLACDNMTSCVKVIMIATAKWEKIVENRIRRSWVLFELL